MEVKAYQRLILFAVLFTIMLGFGIIIPVLPFFSRELGASSLDLGLLMASYSVMQFIFAPIWGNLSDRVGRKPLLIMGVIGFALSFLIFGLAQRLWVLFLARIVGGLLSSAAMPTAMAYISDTTDEKSRGQGMGMMGAAMGLGVIFGPAIGGFLAGYHVSTPFFVAAALAAVNVIFIIIFLPESLLEEERTEKKSKRPSLTKGLQSSIGVLLVVAFIVSFAAANLEATFAYFASDNFGFGEKEMGLAFMIMGIVTVVQQGLVVGYVINRFGEKAIMLAGLFITASAYLLVLSAVGLVSLIFFIALSGVGMGLLRPAMNSLVSKQTPFNQGVSMGMVGSFDSLGRIIGPIWGGFTYMFGTSYPYITGAIIMFSVFLFIYFSKTLQFNSVS
ncbi:multidrug resistance protein [Desulfitispora alkaliphila]|uniref:MFS transporter n=1 Tax=Desulfitispora alkaliphila TaxID=622674 RepID=UPI003D1F637B